MWGLGIPAQYGLILEFTLRNIGIRSMMYGILLSYTILGSVDAARKVCFRADIKQDKVWYSAVSGILKGIRADEKYSRGQRCLIQVLGHKPLAFMVMPDVKCIKFYTLHN